MGITNWKVLVVEDEADSMELVQGILEHYGIHSIAAPTAEEALALLDRETPTLIVVDLALPGMDGWGLLQKLKSNPHLAKIPRVAITAYHTAEVATQAIERGFDAYFSKPIEATSFVRELQGVIEG
jgi:CheY-like chemotaxis protein